MQNKKKKDKKKDKCKYLFIFWQIIIPCYLKDKEGGGTWRW